MNEAQQIMGGKAIPLTAPIKAHGDEMSQLHLRRPTPAEVKKIGFLPYRVIDMDTGAFTPDMKVAGDYISVCAGIPPSSVDQLDLLDLNKLSWAICGFFTTPASSASSS